MKREAKRSSHLVWEWKGGLGFGEAEEKRCMRGCSWVRWGGTEEMEDLDWRLDMSTGFLTSLVFEIATEGRGR